MNTNSLAEQFRKRQKAINDFANSKDIRLIMAREAIHHFEDSFVNEGFTDKHLTKWKDVQRRNKFSQWYGHSGQTGKFSNARTTAPILTGETTELQNAFSFDETPTGIIVKNNKKYARVHNFGGMAKIYGKKPFMMTPRTFMAPSAVLNRNIYAKIFRELKKRLNAI